MRGHFCCFCTPSLARELIKQAEGPSARVYGPRRQGSCALGKQSALIEPRSDSPSSQDTHTPLALPVSVQLDNRHTHTHTHTDTHTPTHTHRHTDTHTLIHIHTDRHTHIHPPFNPTQMCLQTDPHREPHTAICPLCSVCVCVCVCLMCLMCPFVLT